MAIEGHNEANGGKKKVDGPSDEQMAGLLAKYGGDSPSRKSASQPEESTIGMFDRMKRLIPKPWRPRQSGV